MIRDYLRGMQMAYFPPFKMFFLLIALSLVVDSGLNIQGINRSKLNEAEEHEIVAGWFNSEEEQIEKQAKEASTQKQIKQTELRAKKRLILWAIN